MRMHMYANKNDATKMHQIVNQCMILMIFAAKWYSKSRFGVSGRHRPARSEKMLKSESKCNGGDVLFGGLFEHICWKVRSWGIGVFFWSLARTPFFRFLLLLGGFGGALWRGFCANIDCSLENATSQKAWFYLGISTVLTVAAGPGSIKGEKNTHAAAMPVLGSRKNSSANDFWRF